MLKMSSEMKLAIGETCGAEYWEPISSKMWEVNTPWQLMYFEHDFEYEKQLWRVVVIEKYVYDADDPEAIDRTEEVFSSAWVIE